jgi:hypothetical protein
MAAVRLRVDGTYGRLSKNVQHNLPSAERGPCAIFKQARAAVNLGRIRVGGRFSLSAPPGFTFDSSLWLTAPVNHEHNN